MDSWVGGVTPTDAESKLRDTIGVNSPAPTEETQSVSDQDVECSCTPLCTVCVQDNDANTMTPINIFSFRPQQILLLQILGH